MKIHMSLSRINRPLISPRKLEEHFSKHFSARPYIPQPESEHPKNYPYLLPPDDLPSIDTSTPSHVEVVDSMRRLKNGSCQGTDKVFSEQLKYSRSEWLIKYITLLVGMIWSCLQIPTNWLVASTTYLHKRGLKSLTENYTDLSIIGIIMP